MEAAKSSLERIVNAVDNLNFLIKNAKDEPMTAEEAELFAQTDSFVKAFEDAMDDDFNTADAVAAIFELMNTATPMQMPRRQKSILERSKT